MDTIVLFFNYASVHVIPRASQVTQGIWHNPWNPPRGLTLNVRVLTLQMIEIYPWSRENNPRNGGDFGRENPFCQNPLGLLRRQEIHINCFEPLNHAVYNHHSFTVSGLKLWNSFPRNIQESTSLSSFKSKLFKFIGVKPQF